MALQEFRKECRDRARQLEQLVISDVSRGATDLDPSALLAEARRSSSAFQSLSLGCKLIFGQCVVQYFDASCSLD